MTYLKNISSTIHQTLVEHSSICIESQRGDSVALLYELATFLSKPLSWAQTIIK